MANTDNLSWIAAVKMRKSHLLEIFDNDVEKALEEYMVIYDLCVELKDSLCIAESLEQIGDLNSTLGKFAIAETYYLRAIEAMEKIGSKPELALTYNNYSLFLSDIGKLSNAEQYMERAIQLAQENKHLHKEVMYKSNLASIYNKSNKSSKSIELYKQLIDLNKKNQWHSNLLYNYSGIADAYEKINNLEKTNEYTHAYYELKDSINDVKVTTEIKKLRLEMEVDKKEILFQKNKEELNKTNRKYEQLLWLLSLVSFSIIGSVIYLLSKRKQRSIEQNRNLEYLNDLKDIVLKKNITIAEQSKKIDEINGSNNFDLSADHEDDLKLFELRMVSADDVSSFKSYFDKTYPNFVFKIRSKWPSITPAEERLLMLIKLNINTQECSEILGISATSVKKSRYRLRKRLDLEADIDLHNFVASLE